jgi:hypothetical protein
MIELRTQVDKAVLVFLSLWFCGCGIGGGEHVALPPLDTSDIVVQKASSAKAPFGVDICIDATPSMDGFAAATNSTYSRFLEDLEGSLISGVKNVHDLRFFKFGERIREVPRSEFRHARTVGFYHEPGMFRDTNIELALGNKTDPAARATPGQSTKPTPPLPRVTVVITDLFQKDQDVNIVIKQIKDGCLTQGDCSVGVLAIPSEFNGSVYDAHVPTYKYASTADPTTYRPFYLLMFGPEEELIGFADVLSAKPYVNLKHLLIVGPRIVRSFSVNVARDPGAQGVSPRKSTGTPLDSAFNLRSGFPDAKLVARLQIERDTSAFDFVPARATVRTYRATGSQLAPAASEFSIDSLGKAADALEIHATIHPPTAKGDYVYVADVLTGDVNGFTTPHWINDFSSANPTPDHDSGKTLNLDRFVEDLISASVAQDDHQPKLARFRILIHRL